MIELRQLDAGDGFVINGQADESSGISVSSAGDINGDGIEDLAIGAYRADVGAGRDSAGRSYILFGKRSGYPAQVDLGDLDGSNGFTINGTERRDRFGRSVASAGDFNGDDIDDLLVGSTSADKAYLVFGSRSGFSAVLEANEFDGSNGLTLVGPDNSAFGYSASGVGDFNGDGLSDIIAGSSRSQKAYILYGNDAPFASELSISNLTASQGLVLEGPNGANGSAGDINNDGFDDVVIEGARDASTTVGRAHVVFGAGAPFDDPVQLDSLDENTGFTLVGAEAFGSAGRDVDYAGDMNGDGIDDVIIGEPYSSPGGQRQAGRAYVVFGTEAGFPTEIELGELDGSDGFALNGYVYPDAQYSYAGRSVSSAGDVNGDGLDDLLLGAPTADPGGRSYAGEAYLVFGRENGFPAEIELMNLSGEDGVIIRGEQDGSYTGNSVSAADLNGDGLNDLIIGAKFASPNGQSYAGSTYVIYGRNTSIPEPGAAVLAGGGLLAWLTRRRRRA